VNGGETGILARDRSQNKKKKNGRRIKSGELEEIGGKDSRTKRSSGLNRKPTEGVGFEGDRTQKKGRDRFDALVKKNVK